ncbi:MAG: M48 family metallopeptidase [Planctomycetota bacterium]
MQDEFETTLSVDGFRSVDGQRRTARLKLDQEGIEAEDGERIRWRQASLRRDEADGAILVSAGSTVFGSAEPGFLRTLESAAGNDLDRQLARIQGLKTGWRGSQFIGCFAFFLLIGWTVTSIPGCYRSAVDTAIDSMPYEIDVALGEAAQESMDAGDVIEDEVVVEAMRAMLDRLSDHFGDTDVPAADVEWQIRIVESDQINAFALPGGYITVFSSLIEAANDPEMVAGVLAHEMAHVVQRHGLKRVGNQVGLMAGLRLVLGDAGGLIGIAGELFSLASANDYSREQETEADLLATRAMVRAGLDATAFAEFFEVLEREYGDVPSSLEWMSTHPGHDTRIEAIEVIIGEMEPVERRPLEIDWDEVQSRVGGESDGD